jgi:hypothetical protein
MDYAFRKHVFVCTNKNPEKPGRCGDKGGEEYSGPSGRPCSPGGSGTSR